MPCTISTEGTSSCSDTHLYHTKQLQRDKIKHLLLVELDVGYLVNFLKVYGFLDRGVADKCQFNCDNTFFRQYECKHSQYNDKTPPLVSVDAGGVGG